MAVMFKKCNFCNLEAIKQRAGWANKSVTIDTGNHVFVHPPSVNLNKLGDVERGQYWVARFTAIPTECVCHLRSKLKGGAR